MLGTIMNAIFRTKTILTQKEEGVKNRIFE
jgi:hypothetical protein